MSGSPFTREETATILAALRTRQSVMRMAASNPVSLAAGISIDGVATDGGELTPLTADEIDDLCMRINFL